MRRYLWLCTVAVVAVGPAFAATAPKPAKTAASVAPYMPVYPGAITLMELNFTDKDILQTLKQALTGLASGLKNTAHEAEPSEVERNLRALRVDAVPEIISGLKKLRFIQASLPQGQRDSRKITDFYNRALTKDGWNRAVYMAPDAGKAYALFAHPANHSLFLVAFHAKADTNVLFTARTSGFIDVEKAMAWLLNAAEFGEKERAKKQQIQQEQQQQPQPEEATPQPAPSPEK